MPVHSCIFSIKEEDIFIMNGVEELKEIVLHQLSGWWKDYNENIISEHVPQTAI